MGRIAQRGAALLSYFKGHDQRLCPVHQDGDAAEHTVSFVQEIYDNEDHLIGIHVKYPEDTGHQDLTEEEDEE